MLRVKLFYADSCDYVLVNCKIDNYPRYQTDATASLPQATGPGAGCGRNVHELIRVRSCLDALHIRAVAGVDLDLVAGVAEKGHTHLSAGLHCSRF